MGDRSVIAAGVLRDGRRGLIRWALALGAVVAVYASFYPAIGGAEMQAMIDSMPENLAVALGYDRIGSAAGYLTSTVFGLLAPILLLVFGIGAGARLIAGEEEDGTLELELTHPVARRRVAAERLLGLGLSLVALVAVVAAVTAALTIALAFEGVGIGDVLATSLGLLLLVAVFTSLAFAVGAATGRRGLALAVAAGLAVVTYVADALGALVEGGTWVTSLSPFAWYLGGDPMTRGIDVGGYLLLATVPVVAAVFALWAFDRRDLGT